MFLITKKQGLRVAAQKLFFLFTISKFCLQKKPKLCLYTKKQSLHFVALKILVLFTVLYFHINNNIKIKKNKIANTTKG